MYSMIQSGALHGVQAYPVCVEVDIAAGLPGFSLVGSLSGEVRESKERVSVALKNAGLRLPPSLWQRKTRWSPSASRPPTTPSMGSPLR